jgi:hypothetical protein
MNGRPLEGGADVIDLLRPTLRFGQQGCKRLRAAQTRNWFWLAARSAELDRGTHLAVHVETARRPSPHTITRDRRSVSPGSTGAMAWQSAQNFLFPLDSGQPE